MVGVLGLWPYLGFEPKNLAVAEGLLAVIDLWGCLYFELVSLSGKVVWFVHCPASSPRLAQA